jgi:hypothetical protein
VLLALPASALPLLLPLLPAPAPPLLLALLLVVMCREPVLPVATGGSDLLAEPGLQVASRRAAAGQPADAAPPSSMPCTSRAHLDQIERPEAALAPAVLWPCVGWMRVATHLGFGTDQPPEAAGRHHARAHRAPGHSAGTQKE